MHASRAMLCAGHPTRNCPEDRAGWISKTFYFYVNGLMEAGAKKHLEHDDLWDLSIRDQAAPVFKHFAAKLKSTADPVKAPQVCLLIIWLFSAC